SISGNCAVPSGERAGTTPPACVASQAFQSVHQLPATSRAVSSQCSGCAPSLPSIQNLRLLREAGLIYLAGMADRVRPWTGPTLPVCPSHVAFLLILKRAWFPGRPPVERGGSTCSRAPPRWPALD